MRDFHIWSGTSIEWLFAYANDFPSMCLLLCILHSICVGVVLLGDKLARPLFGVPLHEKE